MKLKTIRLDRAQTQQGACCDRTMGPKITQITVEDEETAKRYYCCLSRDERDRELTIASWDILQAMANLYDEDVIPYRLEHYREWVKEEWSKKEQSAFYPCMVGLLK